MRRAGLLFVFLIAMLVGFGPPGAATAQGGVDFLHAEGVDACASMTSTMLNDLYNGTPFHAIGTYIGGENGQDYGIGCYDSPSQVSAALGKGFALMPFWYGLQPTCTTNGYVTHFISTTTGTAYNQGINSAKAAIAIAQSEGFGAHPNRGCSRGLNPPVSSRLRRM
jgi:hypothetical protein